MPSTKKKHLKRLKLSIAAGTLALLALCGAFYSQLKACVPPISCLWRCKSTPLENPGRRRPLPIPDNPAPKWILPVPNHPAVDTWVRRFAEKDHGSFQILLDRSRLYVVPAQRIFVRKGLPKDLIYVALIESGFSSTARSHANAVGMWQIASKTGTRFGLEQNERVDERRHPMKAAGAAADYLSLLYDRFGSWSLALAAYNAGENAVQGALDKSGLKTFWDLLENRYLPAETRDYVPKVFAAIQILKNPGLYGFRLTPERVVLRKSRVPESYRVKFGDTWSTLAARYQCSTAGLAALNGMEPSQLLKTGEVLDLPAGAPSPLVSNVRTKSGNKSNANSNSSRKNLSNAQRKSVRYPVRPGDTLWSIAGKFHVPIQTLCAQNNVSPTRKLSPGKILTIPG